MSSQTQFSAQAQVNWIQPSACEIEQKKAEHGMKSDKCKSRNDISGQSIDIEWHVCLGDTSVQILHDVQVFMSEARREPDSFQDRIIFASM